MKTFAVCFLLAASASAFTTPNFATRAVSAGPVKKVVAPAKAAGTKVVAKAAPAAKKVVAAVKKAAPKKVVPPPKKVVAAIKKAVPVKKAAPVVKKVVATVKKAAPKPIAAPKPVFSLARKAPPSSSGYPSFRSSTESFKPWTKISGGGNKAPVPAFVHPTLPGDKVPFSWAQYQELAKTRLTKNQAFVVDDGLTELERNMRKTTPNFLVGAAKSFKVADKTAVRKDLAGEPYALGLNSDRFQLLFISVFAVFTLVGSLSGALKL